MISRSILQVLTNWYILFPMLPFPPSPADMGNDRRMCDRGRRRKRSTRMTSRRLYRIRISSWFEYKYVARTCAVCTVNRCMHNLDLYINTSCAEAECTASCIRWCHCYWNRIWKGDGGKGDMGIYVGRLSLPAIPPCAECA